MLFFFFFQKAGALFIYFSEKEVSLHKSYTGKERGDKIWDSFALKVLDS